MALFLNRCWLLWFTMTTTHAVDYRQCLCVRLPLFKQLHCSLEEDHQPESLPACGHIGNVILSVIMGREIFKNTIFKWNTVFEIPEQFKHQEKRFTMNIINSME